MNKLAIVMLTCSNFPLLAFDLSNIEYNPCTDKKYVFFDSSRAEKVASVRSLVQSELKKSQTTADILNFEVDEILTESEAELKSRFLEQLDTLSIERNKLLANDPVNKDTLYISETIRLKLASIKSTYLAQANIAGIRSKLVENKKLLKRDVTRLKIIQDQFSNGSSSSEIVEGACVMLAQVKANRMQLGFSSANELRNKLMNTSGFITITDEELASYLESGELPFAYKTTDVNFSKSINSAFNKLKALLE